MNAYLKEISKYPMIDAEEEAELSRLIIDEHDAKAVHRLVQANLRIVVSIAKQYPPRGMELNDLVSEGNIGLVTAAQRYDARRGYRFLTYAVWWIRNSIMGALNRNGRFIRMPDKMVGLQHRIFDFVADHEKEHGVVPSPIDIAEALDMDVATVNMLTNMNHTPVSLSTLVDDEDQELSETLPGDEESTDAALLRHEMNEEVAAALRKLTAQQHKVVIGLFGFEGEALSGGDLARSLGISRQRVKQLKDSALEVMKRPPLTPPKGENF